MSESTTAELSALLEIQPLTSVPFIGEEGEIRFTFAGELDLRSKLAVVAKAWGWLVEQEVVVPGWGRIDLVLRESPGAVPYLIELKLDLTKPAKIRRAFQQADGYGRWWATHFGETNHAYVVGVKDDLSAIRPVQQAYPEVGYRSAVQLLRCFATWGNPIERERLALSRTRELRSLLDVHLVALRALAEARITALPLDLSADEGASPR